MVKIAPSFLSYFKTLSAGLAQGNEPATSHSVVMCVLRTRQVLSDLNVNEEHNMLLILQVCYDFILHNIQVFLTTPGSG